MDGGEDYVTFSACTVNIGNAMCPKVSQYFTKLPIIVRFKNKVYIFQFFQFFFFSHVLKFQSGEFVVPEPGLYLFLVTCCTFDMKKCLLSIRKNGKDVANIHDQDGDTNKVVQDCLFSII